MTTFDDLVPSAADGRFDMIERNYDATDVERLRGSVPIAHTLAERGANKLWELFENRRLCERAWRFVWQSGDADGESRSQGDLFVWLAGRRRR